MKRTILKDPFFSMQPENKFVYELEKSVHSKKPDYYGKRKIKNTETDVHGIYIAELYPDDPKDLLLTVYDDFKRFSEIYEISGDRFPVYLKKAPTPCFEAYTIEVTEECVNIYADDTEGIRRGIIYLQDELRRQENAFLKIGKIQKKPVIHSRITRCFFSPINRAPRFIDELNNDIDYYPDEYLNKLMHDGSNGIWIYTRFSDLMPSEYLEENGVGYEKRIAKLNRVVKKCAKYGIGVYVFAIEPYWITAEQAKKHPQLAGHRFHAPNEAHHNNATLCTNSEMGKAYCYEQGAKLIELVPDLAGVISITTGERPTSCACVYKNCNCEICSKKKPGEVLSDTVEALRSGIRDANPKCKVISWTYGHRDWEQEDINDYIESAPEDAFLMQNFEDMGYEKQLGKTRQCVDYWLSYPGPSQFFKASAKKAKESKKHLFAKMQICCSHELASVPYIPTPGLIFDKYKGAYELGVEGIMQCWYFGNYPSLMSKAAGELAFMEDFSDKDEFLRQLAGIYWGNTNAEKICSVWKEFEASYVNYPMNIMFSYYGPMHDGVVWDLSLKPKNFSLPRTWLTIDPTDGDRIGECLLNGHTLDESCILLEEMQKHWQKGMEILAEIDICHDDQKEQVSVGTALGVLISSGKNILEFYKLRDALGYGKGDALTTLEKMRKIVLCEISNSNQMLELCHNDTRLGYHSEGEGYKFFPEKLRNRVSLLEKLLQTEFVEVENRIRNGLIPLEYYTGVEDNDSVKKYKMTNGRIEDSAWENIDPTRKFRVAYDREYLYLEFYSKNYETIRISPEYRLFFPDADIEITEDFKTQLAVDSKFYYSLFGEREQEELKKYSDITFLNDAQMHFCLRVKLSDIGMEKIAPMKIRIDMGGKLWCEDSYKVITLGKTYVNPGDYGWLIP